MSIQYALSCGIALLIFAYLGFSVFITKHF